MMDFPANPVPGQKFNPGTGSIYTWDGVAWNLAPVNVATARSRNRIINPTAQISQEVGSTAGTTNGYFLADEWSVGISGIVASCQRVTLPSPSPEGTQTGVAFTATTAKASLAAGDSLVMNHPVEGVDIVDFDWGTASAKAIVLRFNVYCEQAGTFAVAITNAANNRAYCTSFTVAAANSWQTVNLAIPGDTTGTWPNSNALGLVVRFGYAIGSTYVGVAGWQAGQFMAPPGCTNGAAVANKNLYITDVAMHLDPDNTGVAPPFNQPSYEDDWLRCLRYWFRMNAGPTMSSPVAFSTSQRRSWVPFPAPMRTNPTLAGNASNIGTLSFSSTSSFGTAPFGTAGSDVECAVQSLTANARMI